MKTSLTPQRYGAFPQLMHWLTALLVFSGLAVGYIMVDLPVTPTRVRLFAYHKWIGVTVFALVVLRLLWRLRASVPPLPPAMRLWERRLARLTHGLLYGLLLAIPLSGWLMSSAKGFQTVYFAVLPIPDLLGKDPALAKQLEATHELLTTLLWPVLALHVIGALKHHFIDRDDVLRRMLPAFGRARGGD